MHNSSGHSYKKCHEIRFSDPNPIKNQAFLASEVLIDTFGIESVDIIDALTIKVSYSVDLITFHKIEDQLTQVGLHLNNSLLSKLKRSLYYYTEENLVQSLSNQHRPRNCAKSIFVHRQKNSPRGCHDNRPEHWRHYH